MKIAPTTLLKHAVRSGSWSFINALGATVILVFFVFLLGSSFTKALVANIKSTSSPNDLAVNSVEDINNQRAFDMERRGDYADAERVYKAWLEKFPDHSIRHTYGSLQLARVYENTDRLEQARATYKEVFSEMRSYGTNTPEFIEFLQTYADFLNRHNDPEQAKLLYQQSQIAYQAGKKS